MGERINKYLASCGLGSRREVEQLVLGGRVAVNGRIISELSIKIEETDKVAVDGKELKPASDHRIIAMNKPAGVLVSHRDKFHEKTVFSLLPEEFASYKYAGRLDLQSRGLLILSRDGELINRLTHPSGNLEKEYLVTLERLPDLQMQHEMIEGVVMDGELLKAKKVVVTDYAKNKIAIVLGEGKKRHIRRMLAYFGIKVLDLVRMRIGKLRLDKLQLPEGSYTEIKKEDIYNS